MVIAECLSRMTGKTESVTHPSMITEPRDTLAPRQMLRPERLKEAPPLHTWTPTLFGFSARRERDKSTKVLSGKMEAVKGMESDGGVILQLILS